MDSTPQTPKDPLALAGNDLDFNSFICDDFAQDAYMPLNTMLDAPPLDYSPFLTSPVEGTPALEADDSPMWSYSLFPDVPPMISRTPSSENSQLVSPTNLFIPSLPEPVISSAEICPPPRKKPVRKIANKDKTKDDLLPIDAPIQSRSYTAPSATSRKRAPTAIIRKLTGNKKAKPTEAIDETSTLDLDLTPEVESAIEAKRKQNTVAARRSRLRKAEHLKNVEDEVARLRAENEALRERAEKAEAALAALTNH